MLAMRGAAVMAKRWAKANVNEIGLRCRRCHHNRLRVRDTDIIPGGVRRYRICNRCGKVNTTIERSAPEDTY